jgi:hypothetical protein
VTFFNLNKYDCTYRKFLLAPSEIADAIIDFSLSTTDDVILHNDANFPFPDGDQTDNITGTVMKFIIKPDKVQDPSRIPHTLLRLPPPLPYEAAQTRYRLYLNSEIVRLTIGN